MKIESVQNKKIKERCKLQTKKERDKTNLFLIEDLHLIQEAIQANCLKELYILEGMQNPVDFEAIECTQAVLNKLSSQVSNSKIIGVCQKPAFSNISSQRVVLCDEIQDPGNLGTIIRTAHSFGLDCIYVSKKTVDVFNQKTIQSSQGALFHMPVLVCDIKEKIKELQTNGNKIYATALHSHSKYLQDIDIPSQYGIVLGNEGNGIQQDIINCCDQCIKIEMETFESLNVAIAGGICMYTFQYTKK